MTALLINSYYLKGECKAQSTTMYKNNSRDSLKLKVCRSLQFFCVLTARCLAIGYYSYAIRYRQAEKY